jgi:hypothetical protein
MGLSLLCGAESGSRSCAGPRSRRVHDLPLSARHDISKPAGHKFLMRRFESPRLSQPGVVLRHASRNPRGLPHSSVWMWSPCAGSGNDSGISFPAST